MNKIELIISYASWEDRFRLGLKDDIVAHSPKRVEILISEQRADWSITNRGIVQRFCHQRDIIYNSNLLDFYDSASIWKKISLLVNDINPSEYSRILVDISTMPRETIWYLLFFLKQLPIEVKYIYHRPKKYGRWLSRDPQVPHLIFKHSGVMELDKPTTVLVTTGYDPDRTFHFYNTYTPNKMIWFFQAGEQFNNARENIDKHKKLLENYANIQVIIKELDAYVAPHGETAIAEVVQEYSETSNVIMSSLGPKPSAIAVYKVWEQNPRLALAYAPSGDYNRTYSHGIGTKVEGTFVDNRPSTDDNPKLD